VQIQGSDQFMFYVYTFLLHFLSRSTWKLKILISKHALKI